MPKPLVKIQREDDLWKVEVDGKTIFEGPMREAISVASRCSRIHNLGVSVNSNCWRELFQFYLASQSRSFESAREPLFDVLKQLA